MSTNCNYTNTVPVNTTNTANSYPYNNGYTCACGIWVQFGMNHQCYNYQQPVTYPTTIFTTTTIPQPDYITHTKLQAIEDRLARLELGLERLLDLLHNNQDEEVCGNPEGECASADSGGGTGMSLEVSIKGRQPRGDFHWPPRA